MYFSLFLWTLDAVEMGEIRLLGRWNFLSRGDGLSPCLTGLCEMMGVACLIVEGAAKSFIDKGSHDCCVESACIFCNVDLLQFWISSMDWSCWNGEDYLYFRLG